MPELPQRQRVRLSAGPVGVDRGRKLIRGMVVAQLGPFKSEGRGEFDENSLRQIVELWPKAGLKSRFSHPNESSDGLGKFLGRARDPRLATAFAVGPDGARVEVAAVRADLHLDPSAFKTPNGNLGQYVLDLAESDPGAISSSLVLNRSEEHRLNADGTPQLSADGQPLPPLWRVKRLYATDVVDEGDAVDDLLGAAALEGLRYTRDYLAAGEAVLGKLFAGQTRNVVKARCLAYLERYLDRRYGGSQMSYYQLGASLGGVLDSYINAAASDERPREVILGQMAESSGKPVEEVNAIVTGESDAVDTPTLQAFATVLGCPLGELVTAAEADGIDLGGAGEAPAEAPAAEAPAAEAPAPMRRKTGPLHRRLAAQERRLA